MAHAALVSLAQTLEQILNANQSQVLDEDIRIRSFHEKVSFFLLFLEDSSQNNSEAFRCLEGRIRDATYKAQDIVDSCMDNQHDELEKVIEEFDSISQEALKMDRNPIEDLPPRNSLPVSAGSSKSGDGNLPASISKLCNLQTLIVYRGHIKPRIATIPSEIWKMPWLRHLLLDRSILACPFGVRNGDKSVILPSLQTLSQITNFRCNKEVLEMIPNLKKLVISYYHDSQTKWSSYCLENLVHLQQLEDLKCLFIAKSYYMTFLCPLPVNLAFPPKLKKLTLSGCGISWKNMTIVGSLPNLEVLKLKDHAFEGPVWETNEGEFCKLKFLLIERTHLENWKASETHFPSLQRLSLRYCYKLVEIPFGIGEIPTLQVIGLYECCPSAVISAELIQEEQQYSGNDGLQVCIYSSKEDYEPGQGSTLHKSTWWY
ncbi:putative late blight resistance proteinR1A-10 [Abeliophyllum distichum]|uniref:Late blight resistance proteinR1A-10 n=1 Tax=Abeliophyllum distichum TaxID=126358 RepID=A0ABD1TKJ2_9LAMI